MPYIKVETLQYPMTEADIRGENNDVIFPTPFEHCEGYEFVHYGTAPAYDPDTHKLVEGAPKLVNGQWQQTYEVVRLDPAEVAQTVEAEKARLLAETTQRRWEIETGGLFLPDDLHVDTERADQDSITRVLVNAQIAGITEVPFKAANKWVMLPIVQLQQIASTIALHVQACYAAEWQHHEAIEQLQTLAEIRAYSVEQGWPSARL